MGGSASIGQQWIVDNVPDLGGQVICVTGSNSGIGAEAALILAARGAHIVMACRNQSKAQAAVDRFVYEHPDIPRERFECMSLDLGDLESVGVFAAEFFQRHAKLDVLLCNAGIMAGPLQYTKQGHEAQFGTNCLGHYALIDGLLPVMQANAPKVARIVMVSSGAHMVVPQVDLSNLDAARGYSQWKRYGETKLGNLLMMTHLNAHFRAKDSNIMVVGCHPGYSATNLQSGTIFEYTNGLFAQSGFMGSLPTVMAATHPSVMAGEYIGPRRFGAWGLPRKDSMSGVVRKTEHAKEVCDRMAALAGLSRL
jgi:hypothetical protein